MGKTNIVYLCRNAKALYFGAKIRAPCACIVAIFDHMVKERQTFAAAGHRIRGVKKVHLLLEYAIVAHDRRPQGLLSKKI